MTEQRIEGTLASFGVDGNRDPFGFTRNDAVGVKFRLDSGEDAYALRIDHPCAGEHLAQVALSVSPYKSAGAKRGALNDFNEIDSQIHARRNSLGKVVGDNHLYKSHATDPHIGPEFREFTANHLSSWIASMREEGFDHAFRILPRLVLLDGLPDFSKWVVSGSNNNFLIQDENDRVKNISGVLRSIEGFRIGFIDFLTKHQDLNFLRGKNRWSTFLDKGLDKQTRLLGEYFSGLAQEDLARFMNDYAFSSHMQVIDFDSQRVFESDLASENPTTEVKLMEGKNVQLSDDSGVTLSVGYNGSYQPPWVLIGMDTPTPYKDASLYPVIAWKKGTYGRKFLTQAEVEGIGGDVFLGRIVVGLSSPQVVKGFKEMIPLHGGEFNQRMMAAQAAVWLSLDSDRDFHARQLLADTNTLMPILESAFD